MEIKTKDGVTVVKERIDIVAILLSNCNEERMEAFGVRDTFQSLAEKFVSVLTDDELGDFIAHNATIKLLNIISELRK